MSTSDSSADVTVIMDGVVSDSINPVFPRALVEKKKYHTIIKSANLLVHEIVYWAQNLHKSQLGHSNFNPSTLTSYWFFLTSTLLSLAFVSSNCDSGFKIIH